MMISLREFRTNAGLTQEALAERLGIARTQVSKWESGSVVPSLHWLKKLSVVLGVAVEDFLSERSGHHPIDQQGIDEAMFKQAVTYAAESMRGRSVDTKEFMGHVFKIYGRIKADPSFVSDESRLSHIKTGIDTALAMLESAAPTQHKPEKSTRN